MQWIKNIFTKKNRFFEIPHAMSGKLVQCLPDAVIIFNGKGIIGYANEAACRMRCCVYSDLIDKPVTVLISDKFSANKEDFIAGRLNVWDGLWRTFDGRDVAVLCSSAVIKNAKGRLTHIAYVAKDMSAIKKNEESLLAAYKKLREARGQIIEAEKIAAVGKLAGGIAHEIRNPLAIILQGTYLLGNFVPADNIDCKETLDMVKEAVKRANNIISRLLEYSRLPPPELFSCDIHTVIEDALLFADSQFDLSGINIVRDFSPEQIFVKADRSVLSQAFFNLIANSIEAMNSAGQIIIKTYKEANKCILAIEDTGCGISEQDLPKVFEPFFTTKMAQKHTGLGLSSVRLIIDRHSGAVNISSIQGKGATATVVLPAGDVNGSC